MAIFREQCRLITLNEPVILKYIDYMASYHTDESELRKDCNHMILKLHKYGTKKYILGLQIINLI